MERFGGFVVCHGVLHPQPSGPNLVTTGQKSLAG